MVAFVLHVGEALGKLAHVVIVDQRDGAYDDAVRTLGRFFDEGFADQVAKRFRAVGVAAAGDKIVEFLEQIGIDGDANPTEFAHSYNNVAHEQGVARFLES